MSTMTAVVVAIGCVLLGLLFMWLAGELSEELDHLEESHDNPESP